MSSGPFFSPYSFGMIVRTPDTSIASRANALVSARRFAEAYELLSGPAGAKDPEALIVLAMWRLTGQIIRRDLAASRALFGQAGKLGHPTARRIHVNFLANGTGGEHEWQAALRFLRQMAGDDEWAAAELAIIDRMQLSPCGEPIALPAETRLSDRPAVISFESLLTPEECEYLIAQAWPSLAPSAVIDPGTGRQVLNPIRTSDSMAFPFMQESPAIHALNRRTAAITGTDVRQGEPLQVLRYRPGQQYRAHFDAESGTDNQRILTVLVYLNEGYTGGETEFVRTGLRFKGRRGDALVFRNALPDGRPDELTQHAGRPVERGEKLIASRWIRQRPFLLQPPEPLLQV